MARPLKCRDQNPISVSPDGTAKSTRSNPQAADLLLIFYMDKNTSDRKDYIMENLVVPVED